MTFCTLLMFALCLSCNASYDNESIQNNAESGSWCPSTNDIDILAIISDYQMWENSSWLGAEVARPFISHTMRVNGKTWQLRTVTVFGSKGTQHHILVAFLINSGGESVMVGRAVYALLQKFGATRRKSTSTSLELDRVHVPLPIKAYDCVKRWDSPSPGGIDHDRDRDIRECDTLGLTT